MLELWPVDDVPMENPLQHPSEIFTSYQIRVKKMESEGRRSGGGVESLHFTFSPPPLPASHPFNPATAPGAILMTLNADEVKMCLRERIPVGRAAAHMHRVRNTHVHFTVLGLWYLNTLSIYIQKAFPARCYLCTVHDLFGSLPGSFPVVRNWNGLIRDLWIKVCLFETLNQLKCRLFHQIPPCVECWSEVGRVGWEVSSEGRKSIQCRVTWIMNKALSPEVRGVYLDSAGRRRDVYFLKYELHLLLCVIASSRFKL